MKERRPGVAALMAFALAAVVLLSSVFERSDILQAMSDSRLLPTSERFPVLDGLVPSLVLASLPVILWVALCAALWPFVSVTTGRSFMVAALVAALPAAILAVLNVLLAPFVPVPSLELQTGMFVLAQVSTGLFGLFLAIALRRSGLFSVWITWLALAWAGLVVIIPLGMNMLLRLYGDDRLSSIPSLMTRYVSPVLLMAFLILLGLKMLALRGVSNKGINLTTTM